MVTNRLRNLSFLLFLRKFKSWWHEQTKENFLPAYNLGAVYIDRGRSWHYFKRLVQKLQYFTKVRKNKTTNYLNNQRWNVTNGDLLGWCRHLNKTTRQPAIISIILAPYVFLHSVYMQKVVLIPSPRIFLAER